MPRKLVTGFDKIAADCRKISKCIKCWDFNVRSTGETQTNMEYMNIEVKLDEPRAKYSDDDMISMVKDLLKKYPEINCYDEGTISGSNYDSYTFFLEEKIQNELNDRKEDRE